MKDIGGGHKKLGSAQYIRLAIFRTRKVLAQVMLNLLIAFAMMGRRCELSGSGQLPAGAPRLRAFACLDC